MIKTGRDIVLLQVVDQLLDGGTNVYLPYRGVLDSIINDLMLPVQLREKARELYWKLDGTMGDMRGIARELRRHVKEGQEHVEKIHRG